MAVFTPVCFVGGVSGKFYIQFGVTMAIAVAISCLNALTLSPALCALIMTPHADVSQGERLSFSSRFHIAFDTAFQKMSSKYVRLFTLLFRHKWVAWTIVLLSVIALGWLVKDTKTGLVPAEDMGSILVNVQTAPGTSLNETHKMLKRVEERIKDIDAIKIYSLVAGTSLSNEQSSSNGNITIKLKNWDERKGKGQDQQSVIKEIYRRTADIVDAKIQVSPQSTLPGFGRISGLDINVQDRKGGTMEDLEKYTNELVDALNKRPEISRAYTNFSMKYPQYRVDVDAAVCKRNGVSPSDVLSAMSGYIGGSYASNFNRFTKLYRVMVQASPEFRADEQALNSIYVKTSSGTMSPIGQYVTLTKVNGSETLSRFNLFPSIAVGGSAAEGYSTGQAIAAVKEVAAQVLPQGYSYEFGGMTRQEAEASNTTVLVFVMCIVFIYLILCALYESLFIPMAVILSVPIGLVGSFLFARMCGLENNIYMQTGLIMLIGLLAKTAILLTEYAADRRREGMTIAAAAVSAARARLRPILMTSATMVFGLLPMAFSTGVGANGNHSLGVGTIGGMLLGTLGLLILVPVLFVVMQWLEERLMPHQASRRQR